MPPPTPRERTPAAKRERTRQDRLAQVMQHVQRSLDGHGDVLIIEFHRDEDMHVSVQALNNPLKGGPALAG